MPGPIDDEAILKVVEECRHPNGTINHTEVGKRVDCSPNGAKRALKRLARSGRLGTRAVLPGFSIKEISEQRDVNGAVKKTWIKQSQEHGEQFEVLAGHSIKGVSALVDADGRTIQKWIKTSVAPNEIREAIEGAFSDYRGRSELVEAPKETSSSLLTVYPTADIHLGLQAWGRETGTSWDLKIARDTLISAFAELIECSPRSETAVLVDLGDYTHNNSQANVTPASGHQLDVDGRFAKIAREAMRIRVELIHLALERHKRVVARSLSGNHDPEVSQMIAIALALFFENNPRVTIDDDPSDFWFYQHGKVMLCANHGHKTKPEKLPGVMAGYRPEMWGQTKFRQAFSGHIHHTRSGEENGARWETLRTIAARDAYAHQHGYTAGREVTSITYHCDRGLRFRQTVEI